jgi:hypothetical protein
VCEIPQFCTGARSTSPLLASEKLGIAKKDFFPREVATLLEQPSGTQLQEALFTRRRRPPCRLQRPSSATIIVLHPCSGDVALGALSALPQRYPPPQAPTRQGIPSDSLGDRTSSSQGAQPTPDGSPPCHILPSSLSSSPPLGATRHHHRFETRVLPHTIAVDMAEAELTAALVMMVGGTRLTVSASQVLAYLKTFF